MNLNPGGCLQNQKFAFYHLWLIQWFIFSISIHYPSSGNSSCFSFCSHCPLQLFWNSDIFNFNSLDSNSPRFSDNIQCCLIKSLYAAIFFDFQSRQGLNNYHHGYPHHGYYRIDYRIHYMQNRLQNKLQNGLQNRLYSHTKK